MTGQQYTSELATEQKRLETTHSENTEVITTTIKFDTLRQMPISPARGEGSGSVSVVTHPQPHEQAHSSASNSAPLGPDDKVSLAPTLRDFEAIAKDPHSTFPYKWIVYGGNHWENVVPVVEPRGFTRVGHLRVDE